MRQRTVRRWNNGESVKQIHDNHHGYSSDEDKAERPYADYDFMAIQEANEENQEGVEDDTESENGNNQDINNETNDKLSRDKDDDDEY
jgi:hypothetical protein